MPGRPTASPGGSAVPPERRAELAAVCRAVVRWAGRTPEVTAVGLAGSWARDAARADSDADLVVLADPVAALLDEDDWIPEAVGRPAALVRTRQWGVLTERRVRLGSGFEVEFGVVPPAWGAEPVDPGTAQVVTDGFRVLHDPAGTLRRLVDAVARARR